MAELTEPLRPAAGGPGQRPGADLERVARSGVLALGGAAAAAVLGVVLVVTITRGFPKEVAGVLFACTSIFLLAYTAARAGAGTGVVYFVSRLAALGQVDRIRTSLRVAVVPVAALSVAIGLALVLAAPAVAEVVVPERPESAVAAIRILAALIPVAALSDVFLSATRGFHRMVPLVVVEKIGRPVLQVALVLVAVAVGARTAGALAAAWALPYLVTAVVGGWWLVRLLGRAERLAGVEPSPAPGMRGEFWRFTAPRSLQSLAQIALQRLDIVLLSALAGPAEAAVYGAVTRFLVFGQLGSQAIATAVQPKLSQLLAHRDHDAVNTLYRASTAWLVLLTWPAYLLFAAFAAYVPLVFGQGYEGGSRVIVVLALAMLVATGCGLVDNVLAMAGRTTWTLMNALLALVVDVVLNLLLIPRYGMVGAAVAWAVAIATNNLVPLTQVAVKLRLHPFGRGTLTAMVVAVACFALLPGGFAVAGAGWPSILGATAVGLVGYLVVLWRLRRLLEIDSLARLLRRPGRRR